MSTLYGSNKIYCFFFKYTLIYFYISFLTKRFPLFLYKNKRWLEPSKKSLSTVFYKHFDRIFRLLKNKHCQILFKYILISEKYFWSISKSFLSKSLFIASFYIILLNLHFQIFFLMFYKHLFKTFQSFFLYYFTKKFVYWKFFYKNC